MKPLVHMVAADFVDLCRTAAGAAILRGKLAALAPEAWGALDRCLRHHYWWKDIDEAVSCPPAGAALMVAAMTCSRNGYLREKALRKLDVDQNPGLLPFLLLRLGDWVTPIRYLAATQVEHHLSTLPAPAWVAWVPLVKQVETQARVGGWRFFPRLKQRLLQATDRDALWHGLANPHRSVRRLCFDWLQRLELDPSDCLSLLNTGLADRDATLQHEAAQAARTLVQGDALEAVVQRMRLATNPAVRREGAFTLVRLLPTAAERDFGPWLQDPNAGVRTIIRKWRGTFDYAAFYRTRLTEAAAPTVVSACLQGLIETAGAESLPDLLDYLDHPSARVRRTAVRGLALLDADVDTLLVALEDGSPAVSEQARQALEARWVELPLRRLVELYSNARSPWIARNIIRLLPAYGQWAGLPYLIEAAAHPHQDVATTALNLLEAWVARSPRQFTPPSAAEAEAVRPALHTHRKSIPTVVNSVVLSILKSHQA